MLPVRHISLLLLSELVASVYYWVLRNGTVSVRPSVCLSQHGPTRREAGPAADNVTLPACYYYYYGRLSDFLAENAAADPRRFRRVRVLRMIDARVSVDASRSIDY